MGHTRTTLLIGVLVVVTGLGLIARRAWVPEPLNLAVPAELTFDPVSPDNPFSTLINEHRLADAAAAQAVQEAPDTDQRREALRRRIEQNRRFADRILALNQTFPDEPQAINALGWVLVHALDSPQGKRALERLLADAIASHQLTTICLQVEDSGTDSPRAERLYRAVWEASPHPDARATAGLLLARRLRRASDQFAWSANGSDDPGDLKREAETLLEVILAEHGALQFGPFTMAEAARAELKELRFLGVGDLAPEIEGQDLNGRPLKLSDSRGRVVVLNFWGHW